MDTRTIEYIAYDYNELSEEAKQKAIEELEGINVDHEWWDYDGHLDLSAKEMAARHITMPEYPSSGIFSHKHLYFDLDRGQSIEFDGLTVNDDNVFRKFLRISKQLWDNCDYSFSQPSHSRFNANNTKLVIEPIDGDFTEKQQVIVDRAIKIFSDKVFEAWVNLRNNYEYQMSREAIEETIEANEYKFFEDGRMCKKICA